jgi:hypothetical protein
MSEEQERIIEQQIRLKISNIDRVLNKAKAVVQTS